MAKKDGELSTWLIVGCLFTIALIGVDVFYSSWGSMNAILKYSLIFGHLLILALWIGVMIKFNDPNFDYLRRLTVWLTIVSVISISIHHATSVEDKQVIIDSKENKVKDSVELQQQKDSMEKKHQEYLRNSQDTTGLLIIGDSKSHAKMIPNDNMGTMKKR